MFVSLVHNQKQSKIQAHRKLKQLRRTMKMDAMELSLKSNSKSISKSMEKNGNKNGDSARSNRSTNSNNSNKSTKSKNTRNRKSLYARSMVHRRLEKEYRDVCDDSELRAAGIPLPSGFRELTPNVICYFTVHFGFYSILALPMLQIGLILLAPLWIMIGIFVVPPILITYLICCAIWCTAPLYVKNFDVDCGYSVNGLENNCIMS